MNPSYKILFEEISKAQMKLNQWSRNFRLEILGFALQGEKVAVLVKRTPLPGIMEEEDDDR